MNETLEGRGRAIKEYSIGVDVLKRSANFDPRTDPIVRVQFRRLRAKLHEYYTGEGAKDAVRIELPKRRYTPFFRGWHQFTEQLGPLAMKSGPSIAIAPFVSLSTSSEDQFFAEGLMEELIHHLMRTTDLRIITMSGTAAVKQAVTSGASAQMVLTGSVRRAGSKLRVSAQLLRVNDASYYIWSEIYEREMADIFLTQQEISRAIAKAIAQSVSYGQ